MKHNNKSLYPADWDTEKLKKEYTKHHTRIYTDDHASADDLFNFTAIQVALISRKINLSTLDTNTKKKTRTRTKQSYRVLYHFDGTGEVIIQAQSPKEAEEMFYQGNFQDEEETGTDYTVYQIESE